MTRRFVAITPYLRRALSGALIFTYAFLLALPFAIYKAMKDRQGFLELGRFALFWAVLCLPGAVGGVVYEALVRRDLEYYDRWAIAGPVVMAVFLVEVNLIIRWTPGPSPSSGVVEMLTRPGWWVVDLVLAAICGRLVAERFDKSASE